MSDSLLHAKNLTYDVEGKRLLNKVSFALSPAECCFLMGPNGAGKSTLLKCLDRLIDGWTGSLSVDRQDVRKLSRRELSRRIGYVPQFKDAVPDFTVLEFLRMSRYACLPDGKDVSALLDDVLKRVGMTSFAARSMATLSGGECQKIFIAAGLVQQTPVLLLDEPTAFLDPRYVDEINSLIHSLSHDDGVSILCVSHDVNASLRYADRLIGLKNGQIHFNLPTGDVTQGRHLDDLFETTFTYVSHPDHPSVTMVLPQ